MKRFGSPAKMQEPQFLLKCRPKAGQAAKFGLFQIPILETIMLLLDSVTPTFLRSKSYPVAPTPRRTSSGRSIPAVTYTMLLPIKMDLIISRFPDLKHSQLRLKLASI